jgi:transposase InsO family protein
LRDIRASDREALLKVKVTERSALVQVAASSQQITAHAGLVLVRELAGRLRVFDYIEAFYNPLRMHTTLGDLSPNEYEAAHHATLTNAATAA